MGEPAEAVFINHVCYGALVGSLSDFFVWNEVTPLNDQNLSEAFFFFGQRSQASSPGWFSDVGFRSHTEVWRVRQSSKIAARY